MAFISSSENPRPREPKPGSNFMLMVNGIMMGLAVTGFLACAFLVVNGKAEEWFRQWRTSHTKQKAIHQPRTPPPAKE